MTAAVGLDVTNNTNVTMYIKNARIMRNGIQQTFIIPSNITYLGTDNLLMREIAPGATGSGFLFFEMDMGTDDFTATPKSELRLVLTLMDNSTLIFDNFIGN